MSEDAFTPPRWGRLLEPLYRGLTFAYHGLHNRNYLDRDRLTVPVVSVGNLTWGGTGKTPVVRALLEAWVSAKVRPAVLTRGYGGSDATGMLRDGRRGGQTVTAGEVGDEPLWLSRVAPEVPIVIGAKRAQGARRLLEESSPVDVFVLDDGFQHRQLHRDLDVVLLDHTLPLGNGRLLPAGPLREPVSALRRADAVVVTGGSPDSNSLSADLSALLAAHAPQASVHSAWTRSGELRSVLPNAEAVGGLAGLRVMGVSGIARPLRFRHLLEAEGAEVIEWRPFPDHHAFSTEDVRGLEAAAKQAGAVPVTTAKDAVRLEGLVHAGAGWLVLDIAVEVDGGWEALAKTFLRTAKKKHRATR